MGVVVTIIILLILIIFSALISGSEVAFFSLDKKVLDDLDKGQNPNSNRIVKLLDKPKHLLATILISNNFVNIAIVIVSTILVEDLLNPNWIENISSWLGSLGLNRMLSTVQIEYGIHFLITVVGVTFILVLFGEIAPKIYANINNLSFAKTMSRPLSFLNAIFSPFSNLLVGFSSSLEHRLKGNEAYQSSSNKEDIDAAIELTVSSDDSSSDEEADILRSILTFGDLATKQIMKSRVDVIALDWTFTYGQVLETIKSSGYSRLPVYEEDFDNIKGILYIKDLIMHLDKGDDFEWREIIRPDVLYTPESKNIDDLLKEFQEKRNHMAIVVDEHGGSSGIVTLEDVMEEVIGEIRDEFDDGDEVDYVKLGEGNYIFEGKSLLTDVTRIMEIDGNHFDDRKGESDTIAGFILESLGDFPEVDSEISYKDSLIRVVAMTNRRIEKVNIKQIS